MAPEMVTSRKWNATFGTQQGVPLLDSQPLGGTLGDMSPSGNLGRALYVSCPAKINLHLRVGPARQDGFHPLLTWMCAVGLFDTLRMRPSAVGATEAIRLTCDPPTLPTDERNLVVRIVRGWAEDLRARHGGALELPGIEAQLTKRTPVGAGLGGGSSNAACALLLARRLWKEVAATETVSATTNDLSSFAARYGSDISFFLHGPSSVCTGRGEIVRPVPPPLPGWALLMLPPIAMPTPAVYKRFDAMGLGHSQDIEAEPDWIALAGLPAAELMDELVNDLEPPAFAIRPELGELRSAAEQALGRTVRMSGSGSSLFTLFDDRAEADRGRARLTAMHNETLRCEVVSLAPPIELEEVHI